MSKKIIKQCQVKLTVPFHDLDAMHVVWHGNYLKYFEIARQKLFDQCGVDLFEYFTKSGYLFPVIRSKVKYIRPLRFNNNFFCQAELIEAYRKVVIHFRIELADDGTLCATGETEQAAIQGSDFKLETLIPVEIQKALNSNP
ncbi:acyl-CoA thioesterase [Thermodesulfobacteriota bacterium]